MVCTRSSPMEACCSTRCPHPATRTLRAWRVPCRCDSMKKEWRTVPTMHLHLPCSPTCIIQRHGKRRSSCSGYALEMASVVSQVIPTWDGTGRWRSERRRAGVRDNERVGAGGDTPPKQWSIIPNSRLKAAVCIRTRRLAAGIPDRHVVVVRSVEFTHDGSLASRRSRRL